MKMKGKESFLWNSYKSKATTIKESEFYIFSLFHLHSEGALIGNRGRGHLSLRRRPLPVMSKHEMQDDARRKENLGR